MTEKKGVEERGKPVAPSKLQLEIEGETLIAVLALVEEGQKMGAGELKRLLQAENVADWFYQDGIQKTLVDRINQGELGRFEIAERKNAVCAVSVALDRMTATITATPAFGGEPLGPDIALQAIQNAGIDEQSIDRPVLDKFSAGEAARATLFAQGTAAVAGENARFETLVDLEVQLSPHIDRSGRAEMHQLQDFLQVEVGAPLVRRVPPTPGIPGRDVLGQTVKSAPGKDLRFPPKIPGAEPEGDLLLATIAGHPVAAGEVVKVEPVLVVNEVGPATGNVVFNGSVDIRGDVLSGFMVQASGDVRIKGVVERARIKSGGDLVIEGGVLGSGAKSEADPLERQLNLLESGGALRAKFVSYIEADVAGDTEIREYLLQSQLTSGGEISLGQSGGTGQIIGGENHADIGIQVNIAGSDAYIRTVLSCGENERSQQQLRELHRRISRRSKEVDGLTSVLEKAVAAGPDRLGQVVLNRVEKIEKTISAGQADIEILRQDIRELEQKMSEKIPAFVDIKKKIFPNVLISIDGAVMDVQEELQAARLVEHDGAIIDERHPTNLE